MAAYLYRKGLETDVGIIDPMDEILEASERGEHVPEDLLRAAQKLDHAIRGPHGLQAVPAMVLKVSPTVKDAEREHRSETITYLSSKKAG
jgi:hypothetical protein